MDCWRIRTAWPANEGLALLIGEGAAVLTFWTIAHRATATQRLQPFAPRSRKGATGYKLSYVSDAVASPFPKLFRNLLFRRPKRPTLVLLQQLLLTRAASRFDLGSGTPKPHTSTAHHVTWALRWSDFSLGKLQFNDFYAVVFAHASLHIVTA